MNGANKTGSAVTTVRDLLRRGGLSRRDMRALGRCGSPVVRREVRRWRHAAAALLWERRRLAKMYRLECDCYHKGWSLVAGVDEAGRGPLAGPLVVGAVVLPPRCFIAGLNDSKQLTARVRENIYEEIQRRALAVSVSVVPVPVIERLNIYQATVYGMEQAVRALAVPPQALLLDAMRLPHVTVPQQAIIKGDCLSASIAAASVVAKVTRDRLMCEYDRRFPQYGFARHKGYATAEHLAALARYGPCVLHRRTFAPVRKLLAGDDGAC